MALFGKKEKKKCPVCGREMGFFSSFILSDGNEICEKCENMLRGEYNIERWWEERFDHTYRQRQYDPLSRMTLSQVEELIESHRTKQKEIRKEYSGKYSSAFRIEDMFDIYPRKLDVGLRRAKQLKGKTVVRGMVEMGSFSKGDSVTIINGEESRSTLLLDVIPCTSANDFNTELNANIHKKTVGSDMNAWLITNENDLYDGIIEKGALIVK